MMRCAGAAGRPIGRLSLLSPFFVGPLAFDVGATDSIRGQPLSIALPERGDTIVIDIPERVVRIDVSDAELARRRESQAAKGWKPGYGSYEERVHCQTTPVIWRMPGRSQAASHSNSVGSRAPAQRA